MRSPILVFVPPGKLSLEGPVYECWSRMWLLKFFGKLFFIYLTTILLQVVSWLVQFCLVTSSFQNTAQANSKKTNNTQNEYTALLESIRAIQKFVNSFKKIKIPTETAVGASGTPCRYKRNKSVQIVQSRFRSEYHELCCEVLFMLRSERYNGRIGVIRSPFHHMYKHGSCF